MESGPYREKPEISAERLTGARAWENLVTTTGDVTALLFSATDGDRSALDQVVPLLYDELRRIAHRELAGEAAGHTLGTTALVNEAYLKLSRLDRIRWRSREHFLGVTARIIRQVLVDYAVRRKAQKRGGGKVPVTLDEALTPSRQPERWLALDQALAELETVSERQARVVECRFFAGMSVEETARALEVSPATVKRDWTLARAWLNRELSR